MVPLSPIFTPERPFPLMRLQSPLQEPSGDPFDPPIVLLLAPPSLLFNFVDGMKEFGLDIRDNRYKFETYVRFSKNPSKYVDEDTLMIIDEVHYFRTMIVMQQVEVDGVMKEAPFKGKVAYHIIEACKKANKILAMTGTAFVNGLYDIENIMAMITQNNPLSKAVFNRPFRDGGRGRLGKQRMKIVHNFDKEILIE